MCVVTGPPMPDNKVLVTVQVVLTLAAGSVHVDSTCGQQKAGIRKGAERRHVVTKHVSKGRDIFSHFSPASRLFHYRMNAQ